MSLADYAAKNQLHRVGARPSLARYLAEAWRRRDFAISMGKYKIQAAHERNRLGMVWVALKPTFTAITYGVVFGLLQGASRPPNFPVFIIIGVFLFQFFTQSLSGGAKSITGNTSLVQSLAFPRIALPVSVVIRNLMELVPMLGVMAVYILILGAPLTLKWLLMIPLVVLFTMFNTGVALITARLTVHVRDLTELLPVITRVLFYTSGVLFSIDRILKHYPSLVAAFDFHPVYEFLTLARSLLMPGVEANPMFWIYAAVWSVGLLIAGTVFFWSAEERYGRID